MFVNLRHQNTPKHSRYWSLVKWPVTSVYFSPPPPPVGHVEGVEPVPNRLPLG